MGGFRVLLIFALACGMLACAAAAEQPEQPTEQPAEQPASESAVATAAAAAAAATESADAAEEAAGGPEEEEDDFDAAVETLTTLASIAARAAKGAHANLKHNNKHKGANKKHHGQAVRVHPGRKWGAPKYGKSKEADAKKQQQQHGPDHSNGSPSGPAHGKKHAPVADGKTAKLQQHKDKDSKDHSSGGYHSGAHAHGKHDGSSLGKHSHKPEVPKAPVFDIEGGEYDSTEREGMPSSKSKEGYSTAEDASKPEPAEASSLAEAKQARIARAPEAAADDNERDAAASKTDDAANKKDDATQQQPKEPEQPAAEGPALVATPAQPANEEVKTATHGVAAEEAAADEELKNVKALLQSGWLNGLRPNQPSPASGDEAPAAATAATPDSDKQQQPAAAATAATPDSEQQHQPAAAAAVPDSDKQQQPETAAAAPDNAQEEPKASFGSQPAAAPSEASGPKVLAAGECPAGTAPATIATSHPELGITVAALTITDAMAADDVGLRASGGCGGKLVQVGGGCDLDCYGERFGFINYMKVHTNSAMSWFNQPTQAVRCSAALFAALDPGTWCTLTPVLVCCVPEGAFQTVEHASARVAKRLGLTP